MAGIAPTIRDLDPEQLAAVTRTGQDVCVVAGPGSGKTGVLVERFAWLVEQGVDPERILAITFTEKAANEIKGRLAKRFAGRKDLREKLERAQVSTIHGFCHAVLRQYALQAGLDPQFEVLEEAAAEAERRKAMEETLDAVAREKAAEFLELAARWPAREMAVPLLAVYDAIRLSGDFEEALQPVHPERSAEELRAELRLRLEETIRATEGANTEPRRRRREQLQDLLARLNDLNAEQIAKELEKINLQGAEKAVSDAVNRAPNPCTGASPRLGAARFAPQRELLCEILRRFDKNYREYRRRHAAVDFTDLEEHTLRLLLSADGVREEIREHYEHILMDELQDTNPIQWKIVEKIRPAERFFAVGDINQSIYGFRHADPALFENYEKEFLRRGLMVDRLERNYRTRPEILAAVERVLVNPPREGIRRHSLKANGDFAAGNAPFVEILCTDATRGDTGDVSLWLARRLRELYGQPLCSEGRPARFSDMAVFVRSANAFASIEQALERFSIPYVIAGGKTFFESAEIIDLLNLLRTLAWPEDEIAVFALLRSPFFGLSDEEIFRRRVNRSLLLAEEQAELDRLRSLCRSLPVSAALVRFVEESGYAAALDPLASANVDKFLRMLDALAAGEGRDPAELIAAVDAMRESAKEANAPVLDAVDAVQLMTIHKAKGLEFPIVAVAALEKGERNAGEVALFHPECGLGFEWQLDSGTKVVDPVLEQAREKWKERNGKELDRLLYVAMTRAKERLILSFRNSRRPKSDWPRLVLGGLGLQIPAEAGQQATNDIAVLTRCSGEPDIPEAPDVARTAQHRCLEPLSVAREAPSRVSVTALAAFAQCPRRYLLDSALGWPTAPQRGGDGDALELGTEVHEYLAGVRQEVSEEARQLARAFEGSELARRAAAARTSQREMDFLVDVEDTLLQGQIDLWFDEGNGPVIVDYKTDRYLGERRMRGYEVQMQLYSIALGRITAAPVREAWLFPLREGRPHRVDISEDALQNALALLREWKQAEAAGDFPVREHPECRWCPHAGGACPVKPADADL
jgi:ATP-dependent helicase/nuclease subunit A